MVNVVFGVFLSFYSFLVICVFFCARACSISDVEETFLKDDDKEGS